MIYIRKYKKVRKLLFLDVNNPIFHKYPYDFLGLRADA